MRSDEHKRNPPARDEVAKHFGVSGQSVQRAKKIKKEAPEKVDDITEMKHHEAISVAGMLQG